MIFENYFTFYSDGHLHRYRKTSGEEKRVAFIGISNWALDPAKMNRGIMLKRNMLDLKELISTAGSVILLYCSVLFKISVIRSSTPPSLPFSLPFSLPPSLSPSLPPSLLMDKDDYISKTQILFSFPYTLHSAQ